MSRSIREVAVSSTIELQSYREARRRRRQPKIPIWRIRILQAVLALCVVAICVRLYYLQIYKGGEIKGKAFEQRQKSRMLIHRGAITDRHGLPLAIDTTRYDLYIHPKLLKVSYKEAASKIARIAKISEEKVYKRLNKGYPVVTVAKHLEREIVEELQALNWPGMDIVPRPFRHYPEGFLAAHILGYVNHDTRGQGGVEQSKQNTLISTGDIPKPQLDGRGKQILVAQDGPTWDITPPLGRHVELTIDNALQHLAEKELNAMAVHSMCTKASAILLDPTNGEILAWANYPTYDPNNYSKFPFSSTKNWAMVDVYQPGSTFKIITVASGLETGAIHKDTVFHDGGAFTVGRQTIHNVHGGNGTINLLNLFIHSSNVASAQLALRMTPKQFYDKLTDFSLGRKTGIDLPGESKGLLLNYKKWKPIDQATTGFGQGAISVTPLQLATAVSAVANRGTLIQPHVIRRIYDPKTGVTERWTEAEKRQVLKPEIAEHVAKLLGDNISMGNQIAGKIPGYVVAGKTGTAQRVREGGKGYARGQTIASFIGFLPADDPQILCLVVVDNPQTDGKWGNTIAGPVFNAITSEAARFLGIPKSYETNEKNGQVIGPFNKIVPKVVKPSVKYAEELAKYNAANGDGDANGNSTTANTNTNTNPGSNSKKQVH